MYRICLPILLLFSFILLYAHAPAASAESISVSTTVPDTRVTFIGTTSPNGFVTFLDNNIVVGTTIADSAGTFIKTLTNQTTGIHTFGMFSRDSINRLTPTYSFNISLVNQTETTISGILLPTTIEPSKPVFTTAELATIVGQAAPDSTVNLFVQSDPLTFNFPAGGTGDWVYPINASLEIGDHTTYAKLNDNIGHQSIFSNVVNFTVVAAPTPTPTLTPSITPTPAPTPVTGCNSKAKSDINQDSLVNLTDFSIMMFDWETSANRSDLNCDGIVNLTDFSILLFNWTG